MKRLLLSALLLGLAVTGEAATLIYTCPTGVVQEGAAGFAACPSSTFETPVNEAMVLRGPSSTPVWNTLGPLSATTTVRTCDSALLAADRKTCSNPKWVAKSTLSIASSPAPTPAPGNTAPVVLSWKAPTTNTDDSLLTNLGGFYVYEGTTSPPTNKLPALLSPNTLTYTVTGLSPGVHYFAVTAYNVNGVESVLSAIASKDVQALALPTIAFSCSPIDGVEKVTATCSWSVSNATSCDGSWEEAPQATSGTKTLELTKTTTLTLSCSGPGGLATSGATISVSPRPNSPTDLAAN